MNNMTEISRQQGKPHLSNALEKASSRSSNAGLGFGNAHQSNHPTVQVPHLQASFTPMYHNSSESHEFLQGASVSENNELNTGIQVAVSGVGIRRQHERKNIVLCFDGTGTSG
jgi:hypothetical protein